MHSIVLVGRMTKSVEGFNCYQVDFSALPRNSTAIIDNSFEDRMILSSIDPENGREPSRFGFP